MITGRQRRLAVLAVLAGLAVLPVLFTASWLLSDPDPSSDAGDGVAIALVIGAAAAMVMFVPALRSMVRLARTPAHLQASVVVIVGAALASSATVWLVSSATDLGQWTLLAFPLGSLAALAGVDAICRTPRAGHVRRVYRRTDHGRDT